MVPGACCNIHFGIAVMDHMKFPHPFDLVHHKMRGVLSEEIHKEQAQDNFNRHRHFDHIEETEFVFHYPVANLDSSEAEDEVQDKCRAQEHQVNTGMFI